MITLAILVGILALLLFGTCICIIAGGITGIAIVADIVIAAAIIGLIIRLIVNN